MTSPQIAPGYRGSRRRTPADAHYYETEGHGLPFGADTRADVLQRSIAFFRLHRAL